MLASRPSLRCRLWGRMHRHADAARQQIPAAITAPAAPSPSRSSTITIRKPQCDLRQYRSVRLRNGTRLLLVSDPEATFAAACANVRAGYFDDPDTVPGLAHFLEHAVHLGSNKFPDPKAYKSFLSQHGGTCNASTSMVHTSFHFKVHHLHVQGALDRFAQFFISPLLLEDAAMAEVENVHAEFSRNCNSDVRKLLQLRRSCLGPPYNKFSTGNVTTLRDTPSQQGLPMQQLLRQYWGRRYTGDSICCCVVAPQSLDQLEQWATASFADVRPSNGVPGHPVTAAAATAVDGLPAEPHGSISLQTDGDSSTHGVGSGQLHGTPASPSAWQDWPLDYSRVVGPGELGLLYRVRPQRELRELEVRWYVPYGSMQDVRCKPWRFVGHLLGHEAQGSLAYSLKQAGLVQSLVAGMGDEVRLGRGFMFWGLTLSLTEEGLGQEQLLLEAVYEALRVVKQVPEAQRREIHQELQQLSELNFEFQDRQEPLDLAKDVANRLHYFEAEDLLAGPSLIQQYDGEAIDQFLSHLVPETMNVYFSSQHHPPEATPHKERWYGAKYGVEQLSQELVARLHARMSASSDTQGSTSSDAGEATSSAIQASADDTGAQNGCGAASAGKAVTALPLLPLHLVSPNWALPVSIELCQPSSLEQPDLSPSTDSHSSGVAAADLSTCQASAATSSLVFSGVRQRPSGPPVLAASLPGLRAWHQANVSLALPKAYVNLHIVTPEAYHTPRHWVLSRLYCRLLNDLLEPQAYFAQLAATSYSLSCSETGLVLQLQGYSTVVRKLLQVVLQGMASGMLDAGHVRRRFGVHEGQLRQSWQVWSHNNPLSHAEYHTDFMQQQPHWHVTRDGLALLQQDGAVGPDDVLTWATKFASGAQLHVNMLAYGNVSRADTQDLAHLVHQQLKPQGLSPERWPEPRVLQLLLPHEQPQHAGHAGLGVQAGPASSLQQQVGSSTQHQSDSSVDMDPGAGVGRGDECVTQGGVSTASLTGAGADCEAANWQAVSLCYQPDNPNPSNTNSAAFYLCQIGNGAPWDVRLSVLVELLSQVASKPCFHSLRTVQRLGYTAGCQVHRLHSVLGFAVKVQSPNHPASHLRGRIAQWLLDFKSELEQLSQERLQHFKDALGERYREPPKSLGEAAAQAWLPIRRGTLDFDTRLAKASIIDSVTLEELVTFYDRYVSPANPSHKALCCEVQGGTREAGARSAADALDHSAKRVRLETDCGMSDGPGPQLVAGSRPWLVVGDAGLAAMQQRMPAFAAKQDKVVVQHSRL